MTVDFYGKKLNTYRANLHTHTTNSDGKFTPDEVLKLYADAGYDVMCLTDHMRTNRLAELDPHGMLLISGVELHPAGGRIRRSHLLAVNVPGDFDISAARASETGENYMQQTVDAVNAAGGLCFFAHPYWCGFRAGEIAALHGLAGLEVYNTSTRYIGRAYNMQLWDELCDMGHPLPALAVDDTHRPRDLFMGWTEICCEERTLECVVDALRRGSFYATQGPRFKRLSFENGIFEAEFTPVTSAIGLSNQCRGFCAGVPNFTGDGSAPEITSCRFDLSNINSSKKTFIDCSYLRCQIIDAEGRHAWSNPIPIR
jgi:hypothetical protein